MILNINFVNLQKVKEDTKSHADELEATIQESDAILNCGSPGNLQDLAKSDALFRGKWSDINREVTDIEERFRTCLDNWTTFKGELAKKFQVYIYSFCIKLNSHDTVKFLT